MIMVPPPPFHGTPHQFSKQDDDMVASRRESQAPTPESAAVRDLSRQLSSILPTGSSLAGLSAVIGRGGNDWPSSFQGGSSFLPLQSRLGPLPTSISSHLSISQAAGRVLPFESGLGRIPPTSISGSDNLARIPNLQLQSSFNNLDARQRGSSELSRLLNLGDPITQFSSELLLSRGLGMEQRIPNQLVPSSSWIQSLLAGRRHSALLPQQQYYGLVGASQVSTSNGLDLLRSIASATRQTVSGPPLEATAHNREVASVSNQARAEDTDGEAVARLRGGKLFISSIREWDVLCGRGGKSNHHPGNKRYRQVVSEMKASYRHIEAKSAKTDLSKAIVEHVFGYGGRFIKVDKATGRYYALSPAESRKKTSQALRETKELKWTL